jgi:rhamnulokinase
MNSLAIDIGAGSGRIIRGTFKDGRICLEEVHRFENRMKKIDGHLRWDVVALFQEVCKGLKKVSKKGPPPSSLGIDTWGVDFVLLDADMKLLELPVAYRDPRTDGMMERFWERMDAKAVYERTGIQFMQINTLYQLFSIAQNEPGLLRKAKHLLMIPDYLNFLLTGNKCMEFTNSSTTQLLNVGTKDWDKDILEKIPLDPSLLTKPVEPGTKVGKLTSRIQDDTGLPDIPVIAPATHDTGSAVASIPAKGHDWAFISSGTWSLMGKETGTTICTKEAREHNFTNEGGVYGTNRFLKNIMGMWLINGLRESLPGKPSFSKLEALARKAKPFRSCFIDPTDPIFLNPPNMKAAFDKHFRGRGKKPNSTGSYVRTALEGLALTYRKVFVELIRCKTGKIERIHIIGGGSQNRLLNQMTADAVGLPVYTGPVEGTAVGNLIVQAISLGEIKDLKAGRMMVNNSFNIEEYIPKATGAWDNFAGF